MASVEAHEEADLAVDHAALAAADLADAPEDSDMDRITVLIIIIIDRSSLAVLDLITVMDTAAEDASAACSEC